MLQPRGDCHEKPSMFTPVFYLLHMTSMNKSSKTLHSLQSISLYSGNVLALIDTITVTGSNFPYKTMRWNTFDVINFNLKLVFILPQYLPLIKYPKSPLHLFI